MARIQEEVIVITISKLRKDTPNGTVTDSKIVDDDQMLALETVVQELIGSDVMVEVNKA